MTTSIPREAIEWSDIWVAGANADDLPRVLLIGDSIARSYFGFVDSALKGRFHVARLTTSRAVCDPAFLKELDLLLNAYPFAVVHVNNGLHGWAHTEAEYLRGVRRLFKHLHRRSPASRLLWAHTTPVRVSGNLEQLDPRTERVRERNRLSAHCCVGLGIAVNDLFGVVIDHPEYYAWDGVHFNAAGQEALGRQVVSTLA